MNIGFHKLTSGASSFYRSNLKASGSDFQSAPPSPAVTAGVGAVAGAAVGGVLGYRVGSQHQAVDQPTSHQELRYRNVFVKTGTETYNGTCNSTTYNSDGSTSRTTYSCLKVRNTGYYRKDPYYKTVTNHTVGHPYTAVGGALLGAGLGAAGGAVVGALGGVLWGAIQKG